jgi:hypothetical protein
MERLTLENPEHGIPPDLDSVDPHDRSGPQVDIVATLRAEGRNVAVIDFDCDEPDRRTATLEAMRGGADFIVNGQLAVGNLSGSTSLLMRTSGYSELGDFLYIPCETQAGNTLRSAFRLCFVAELLHNLQGQLPPQMLIIRDGADVVPLQTEDYIYYCQAVQKRFLQTMDNFRKHRMPDPAESAHFGRWSDCASEVLKQRALSQQQRSDEQSAEDLQADVMEMPQLRVASGAGNHAEYDIDVGSAATTTASHNPGSTAAQIGTTGRSDGSHTLAEQARLLTPSSFGRGAPPGHTPNLARFGRRRAAEALDNRRPGQNRRSSDSTLENLEFIGSSPAGTVIEMDTQHTVSDATRPAPAPSLRESPRRESEAPGQAIKSGTGRLPELEPRAPLFLPPDQVRSEAPPAEPLKPRPRESAAADGGANSVIDMDSAPAPTLAPVVQRAGPAFERLVREDPLYRKDESAQAPAESARKIPDENPFSSSLITSAEFDD